MSRNPSVHTRRSPKGLVRHTVTRAEPYESLDPGALIEPMLKALENEAKEAITLGGKDPGNWGEFLSRRSEEADSLFFAARIIENLQKVYRSIAALSESPGCDATREMGIKGIEHALALAHIVGCFRIVQHEASIAYQAERRKDGRRGADVRQAKYLPEYRRIVSEYFRRKKTSRKTDTALERRTGNGTRLLGGTDL
jgi:hypothetical protein